MPSPARGTETRERLIRAAMDAFAARGFRGTSLDSIADTVGVTRQALLHHFPTKTDLLLAVLAQRDADDVRWAQESGATADGDLAGSLRRLMRRTGERPDIAGLFTVVAAESVHAEHPAHAYFQERYRDVRRAFAEGLAEAQRSGRLAEDVDAGALAAALPALLDGLSLQRLLDPDLDVDAALAAALEALLPPPATER